MCVPANRHLPGSRAAAARVIGFCHHTTLLEEARPASQPCKLIGVSQAQPCRQSCDCTPNDREARLGKVVYKSRTSRLSCRADRTWCCLGAWSVVVVVVSISNGCCCFAWHSMLPPWVYTYLMGERRCVSLGPRESRILGCGLLGPDYGTITGS